MCTEHRWYIPQTAREAADAVENVKAIISFLSDTISQEGLKPGSEYRLSENGLNGLYQIYNIIENVLDMSNRILVREVRV